MAPYSPADWSCGCSQACTCAWTNMDLTEHVGYTYEFLRPCGQNTPGPYSRVISYGIPTGCRSVRLSKPRWETDGLRHIAPCAEDRCMNYTKTIYQLGQHTRTHFPTNIKIKGEKLAQSLVCCPTWQHQAGNTDHQTPFILTAIYIGLPSYECFHCS